MSRLPYRRRPWLLALIVTGLACGSAELPAPPRVERSEGLDPAAWRLIERLVEATSSAPRDAAARARLAAAYQANDLPQLAIEAYDQALTVDGDQARWWYQTARLHHRLGHDVEALIAIDRAIDLQPDQATPRCRKGFWQLETGHLEAARVTLEQALELAPASRLAATGLARLALENGDHHGARSRLEALVARHPRDRHLRHLLGVAHRGLGDLEKARIELARGTGSHLSWRGEDPWTAELEPLRVGYKARLTRARALLGSGRAAQAIPLLDRLLDGHPEDIAATTTLASAYSATRRFDLAQRILTSLGRKHPEEIAVHLNLGRLHQLRGDLEQALRHTEDALTLHPGFAFGLTQKARQLLMLERFDEAAASARHALDSDPSTFEAWMILGKARYRLGHQAEAADTFQRASARFPHESEPFLLLAIIRDRQGDRRAAEDAVTEGLAREPNASVARQLMALAKRLRRQPPSPAGRP